jgi:hypothetical protein
MQQPESTAVSDATTKANPTTTKTKTTTKANPTTTKTTTAADFHNSNNNFKCNKRKLHPADFNISNILRFGA